MSIEDILEYTQKLRRNIYKEMDFCREHGMEMECKALQYKVAAISEIRDFIMCGDNNNLN